MNTRPRGYGAPLAALIAGLSALVVFNLTRHSGSPGAPHASVHPSVTLTGTPSTHASPAGQAPAGRGVTPPSGTVLPATAGNGPGAGASPGAPSPVPTPPGPSPSPTPSRPPRPGVGVTAAVILPLRGAAPVTVRAALIIGAAPPFPTAAQLPLVGDGVLRLAVN